MKQLKSVDHPLVKHLVKLRLNRDYRYDCETVVVAGIKPVNELAAKFKIKTLFIEDETFLPKKTKAEDIYVVSEPIMKKVSGMVQPEGVLAEIYMPPQANFEKSKKVVVLDGINDPGNMGALLRTALAMGYESVFILENSCDPYNDKALKAARGATFKIPHRMGSWDELKKLIQKNRWEPLVADLNGTAPEKIKKKDSTVIILSNEAHGLSEEGKQFSKVTIPMKGEMESLNVAIAGGILMYLLR